MRTKDKLIELANNSKDLIYKDIAICLSKKIFINKWTIEKSFMHRDKQDILFDKITYNLWIEEYYFANKKEIKKIEKMWFGKYKRFDTRFYEWKFAALDYALLWHLNRIISEFKD